MSVAFSILWFVAFVEQAHSFPSLLLLVNYNHHNAVADPIRCVTPDLKNAINFCASWITYPLPSTYNQTLEDEAAEQQANDVNECPYYGDAEYQCRKHFPGCTSQNETVTVVKVCRSSCYDAMTWSDSLCRGYSTEYFTLECTQNEYYSDGQPPSCSYVSVASPTSFFSSSSSASWWWKFALVSILGVIAVGLLASYFRTCWRERMTMEDLDREEERERTRGSIFRILRETRPRSQARSPPPKPSMPSEPPTPRSNIEESRKTDEPETEHVRSRLLTNMVSSSDHGNEKIASSPINEEGNRREIEMTETTVI